MVDRNPNPNNNSGYRGNRVLWSQPQPHHLAGAEGKAQRYPGHYNQNQYNQSTTAWSSQYPTKKCVEQNTKHVHLEIICPKALFTSHYKQWVFKKLKIICYKILLALQKKKKKSEARKERGQLMLIWRVFMEVHQYSLAQQDSIF